MKLTENQLREMINEEIKTQKLILEYVNADGTLNEGPFSAFFKTLKNTAQRAVGAAGNAIKDAGSSVADSAQKIASNIGTAINKKITAASAKIDDTSVKIMSLLNSISDEYKSTLANEYQSEYETEQSKIKATIADAANKCLQNYLPFAKRANIDPMEAASQVKSALFSAANTIGKAAKEA